MTAGYPAGAQAIIAKIGIPTAIRRGLWQGETTLLSHDGREIPMSQVILAHREPDGSVEYLSTIARDISERKRYLAQLEAERAKLQAVIDHAPEAIVVVDRESRIVMANPAAQRLYAQPALFGQEFDHHKDVIFCYPSGVPYEPRDLPLHRSALNGESFQNVEMILYRPDRRERTLLTSSVPIRDAQGKIGGAVGVFQDITERRQMETALRESQAKLEIRVQERTAELAAANRDLQNESAERSRITEELSASEERFRQLAEHVREVFWMSEADYNRILYVSPVYEQLTGHTCQSLYERSASFLEFVHDEDRQQLLDRLVTQSAKSSEAEYRVVRPDGSVRWVQTRAFPIRDAAGQVYRIAGISDDITDRVQARQILEKRVAERTHELATLLEISRNMALTLELEPMLAMILDQLGAVLRYDGATIFKLEKGVLSALIHRGPIPPQILTQIQSPPASRSFVQELLARQDPVIIPDILDETPLAQAFREKAGERLQTSYTHVRCWMGLPLLVKDQPVGMLALHCSEPNHYSSTQADLALAFANQAAIAIENARLNEQAQELATLEERQRLARELHDAVSQTLFSASLSAEVLPRLWEKNPAEGQRCLEELHRLTRGALAEMRTLLIELRPSALTDIGLGDLLHQLAEAITNRVRMPVSVRVDRPCSLPGDVQITLYRIAQEALNNVVKHAEAQHVELILQCTPSAAANGGKRKAGTVELHVEDDGRGFDSAHIPPECMGMNIMRERAEAIGAAIDIDSQVDRGTHVAVTWTWT